MLYRVSHSKFEANRSNLVKQKLLLFIYNYDVIFIFFNSYLSRKSFFLIFINILHLSSLGTKRCHLPHLNNFTEKLNFRYLSQLTCSLESQNHAKNISVGSSEFHNQNLRQIGPGVFKLWLDKQTRWLDARWGGYGLSKVIRCKVRRIWFAQSY